MMGSGARNHDRRGDTRALPIFFALSISAVISVSVTAGIAGALVPEDPPLAGIQIVPMAAAVHPHSSTAYGGVSCNYIGTHCDYYDLTLDSAQVVISAHTWSATDNPRGYLNKADLVGYGHELAVKVASGTLSQDGMIQELVTATQTNYHKQWQINKMVSDLTIMQVTIELMQSRVDNFIYEVDRMKSVLSAYRCPDLLTITPCYR